MLRFSALSVYFFCYRMLLCSHDHRISSMLLAAIGAQHDGLCFSGRYICIFCYFTCIFFCRHICRCANKLSPLSLSLCVCVCLSVYLYVCLSVTE